MPGVDLTPVDVVSAAPTPGPACAATPAPPPKPPLHTRRSKICLKTGMEGPLCDCEYTFRLRRAGRVTRAQILEGEVDVAAVDGRHIARAHQLVARRRSRTGSRAPGRGGGHTHNINLLSAGVLICRSCNSPHPRASFLKIKFRGRPRPFLLALHLHRRLPGGASGVGHLCPAPR